MFILMISSLQLFWNPHRRHSPDISSNDRPQQRGRSMTGAGGVEYWNCTLTSFG
jgi:hypothetical protein